MFTRKDTREWMMKVLYRMDLLESDIVLDEDIATVSRDKDKEYATILLQSYKTHLTDVDSRLEKCLDNWDLKNLNKVDLAILRLSALEMDYLEEVPSQVSINEAIELAKKYSSDEAPGFIHGVLGQYYRLYHE